MLPAKAVALVTSTLLLLYGFPISAEDSQPGSHEPLQQWRPHRAEARPRHLRSPRAGQELESSSGGNDTSYRRQTRNSGYGGHQSSAEGSDPQPASRQSFPPSARKVHSSYEEEGEGNYRKLDMELVIARFNEDLQWLAKVPPKYTITIYNKGGLERPMPNKPKWWPKDRPWRVVDLPNEGGEANSFATHLFRNYDRLATYTIFAHGDPLAHNKHFITLLQHPDKLTAVQTMSSVTSYRATPAEIVEVMQKSPWFRSERIITRTLNTAWCNDEGSAAMEKSYRNAHQLPMGVNLIRYHLGLLGLPDWMPESQEICSFAIGGMLGFERERARQHPRSVYELALKTSVGHAADIYVLERAWLVLLGGPNYED